MKTILIISILFALVIAQDKPQFEGNVTVSNPEQFVYRKAFGASSIIPMPRYYGWFLSTNLEVEKEKADLEVFWGVAHAIKGEYVGAWFGSFTAEASRNAGLSPDGKPNNDTNINDANISLANKWIGTAYLGYEEFDKDGNSVKNISLSDLHWEIDYSNENTGVDDKTGLYWITFIGYYPAKLSANRFITRLRFLVSSRLGKLSELNTVVTPTSMESFCYIENWQPATDGNQLKMHLLSITGFARYDESLKMVISGPFDDEAFFQVKTDIQAKKTKEDAYTPASLVIEKVVKVTFNIFGAYGKEIELITLKKYNHSEADLRKWTIAFPPGSTYYKFDPTLAVGAAPEITDDGNGASALVSTISFIFIAVMLLF